ncbi:MAG: hypothetical protein WA890_10005 [Micromonospora sp.]
MRPVREWVVLGAGVAAIVGSFMPWAKIIAPILGTMTLSGVDGSDGWITAALGLVIALYGGFSLRGQRMPMAAPILAGLASVALLGIGVWKIVDLHSTAADMRARMSGEDDLLGIGKAMSDAVHVSVGAGLWLLTLAGLVGAAAVGMILIRRTRLSE